MTAYVRVANPVRISACPTGSKARARNAFDSGTKRAVKSAAAIPIGTLIQKIDRHPIVSVSAPPISGPTPSDTPATAPQMPTARARAFASGNAFAMSDSATGLSIDAPNPWSALNPISCSIVDARLHSSDPTVKTPRPIWNTRLRPNRSETDPASIRKLATTSV